MADEPDRDGSDDADQQPSASTDETPAGDDDAEQRTTDDADEATDDETTDDTDDEASGGDDGGAGDAGDEDATNQDDTADGDGSGDKDAGERDTDGNLQAEPDGQRDDDAVGVGDVDADESTDVDAVDLDAVEGADDLNGAGNADGADDTDESTDTGDIDEGTDDDGTTANDGTTAGDEATDADADGSSEDATDAGDDAFPVAGMTAEEAAWDPDESTDPEEIGVDVDDDEPAVEAREADQIGVEPERQEISDDFWSDGPESDQEMPLADHIEEMMRRLGVVFLVGGVVTLLVLGAAQAIDGVPTAVDIIDALWNHNVPGAPEQADRRPRVYGPLELILTKLKVAGLAGLLVGLPVFVYETYLFMRPGLYPRERRYYLAAVPTSLVLGIIGMTFAHFVVLPAIFSYFTTYTVESATVAFGLSETFNLILLLMGYMAIVFQIPLFIMLAIMMNLVTRVWLEDKRLLFWGAFAGLAFLVSPDPTGMAPIIIAATMIVLYEGTLALLRWTGN